MQRETRARAAKRQQHVNHSSTDGSPQHNVVHEAASQQQQPGAQSQNCIGDAGAEKKHQ